MNSHNNWVKRKSKFSDEKFPAKYILIKIKLWSNSDRKCGLSNYPILTSSSFIAKVLFAKSNSLTLRITILFLLGLYLTTTYK